MRAGVVDRDVDPRRRGVLVDHVEADQLRLDLRRRLHERRPRQPPQSHHRHHDDRRDRDRTAPRRRRGVPLGQGLLHASSSHAPADPSLAAMSQTPPMARARARPPADARARPPRRRVEQGRRLHGDVRRAGRRRPRRHLHRRRARLDPQPEDGPPRHRRQHHRGAPPGDGAGPRHPRHPPGLAGLRRLRLARGRPAAAAARGLLRAGAARGVHRAAGRADPRLQAPRAHDVRREGRLPPPRPHPLPRGERRGLRGGR